MLHRYGYFLWRGIAVAAAVAALLLDESVGVAVPRIVHDSFLIAARGQWSVISVSDFGGFALRSLKAPLFLVNYSLVFVVLCIFSIDLFVCFYCWLIEIHSFK